jgi:putative protein-disulfide isomerase
MSEKKGKVIYIYDAFCGWCYGFSPVITKIFEEIKEDFEFEILSGGMIMGEREGIVQPEMAKYILEAIPRVEEYTGVKFGEAHKQQLREGHLYQSSLKPSAALCAFKKLLAEEAIYFAASMQQKFFKEGKSLEENKTYREIVSDYELDEEAFIKDIESDKYKYLAHVEFDYGVRMGVKGFPALIGIKDNEYYWLSEGYQPYKNVKKAIEQFTEIGVGNG